MKCHLMKEVALSNMMFDTRGASEYCGLSKPTMERFRISGDGPIYMKLGKAVRYRKADLDAWLDRCATRSTHQAA